MTKNNLYLIEKKKLSDKNSSISKYLSKCNIRETFPKIHKGNFKNSVVIPLCREKTFIYQTLDSLTKNSDKYLAETMIIIVINNPPAEKSNKGTLRENHETFCELCGKIKYYQRKKLSIFLLDAYSEGKEIPEKHGVGGARKTGMDIAVKFIPPDGIILSLDSDTLVENNYLSEVCSFFNNNPEYDGVSIKFRHQTAENKLMDKAVRAYEKYLDHYVNSLKKIKSPYAYHVMGSAFACKSSSYVRAGGMKKKNGAEDFYFLQDLSKTGKIIELNSSCVYPSARISDRVPFGTGPKIAEFAVKNKKPYFHNSEIFRILGLFFKKIENNPLNPNLDKLPEIIKVFLEKYKFQTKWNKIKTNTPNDKKKLIQAFHTWFDSFRILKFVHFCEEKGFKREYFKL